MTNESRVMFLSHGGGPMPLLGDEGHKEMVDCLKEIALTITKPSAIVVISAHWEEVIPTITTGENPSLIYDYSGFPEESYNIKYPCKGEPLLAEQIYKVLVNAGIKSKLDNKRGFDHGFFVPLKIMYPDADIPCIQLSLVNTLDPLEHIKIGQALQYLRYDNLLIIGSDFSFHNIGELLAAKNEKSNKMNSSFENWLIDTCSTSGLQEGQRTQKLISWHEAPSARFCHPKRRAFITTICYYMFVMASPRGLVKSILR